MADNLLYPKEAYSFDSSTRSNEVRTFGVNNPADQRTIQAGRASKAKFSISELIHKTG